MALQLKDKVSVDVDLLDGKDATAFGLIYDTAYGAGWEAETTKSPSAHVLYDKIQTLGAGVSVADLGGGAEAVGGAHNDGAAATAARSDHVHEITNPKLDDLVTPDDNTDLNANTTNHGLILKAVAPAAGLLSVPGIANGETAYAMKPMFDTTAPAAIGTAAAGSQVVAARRDHVHAMPAYDTFQAMTQITGFTLATSWVAFDPASNGITFTDGAVYLFKLKVTGTTTTTVIEAVGQMVYKSNGPDSAGANEILLSQVSQSAAADKKVFLRQVSAGTGGAWTLEIAADSDLGASAKIDATFRRMI